MLIHVMSCQNEVSADQYHLTISWTQVKSSLISFKNILTYIYIYIIMIDENIKTDYTL